MISYIRKKGRSNLQICEDSLTASVFDGLKYLPTEIFYSILKNAMYQDKFPKNSGELINIIFWDKWDAKDTSNSKFVEPDLLLQFDDFDIIIEAKRFDNFQQSKEQMEKEIKAYYNVFDGEKELFFVQLGGLYSKENEDDFCFQEKKIKIVKTDWTRLLHEIIKQRNIFQNASISQTYAYCRILDDVRKAFEMHNFYEMKWMKEIKPLSITNIEFNTMNFLKK
jgi:hypothetical protein